MKQCPECGGYMTWYCTATGYHGWRCMCGYDTGNVSVTYSTSITISNDSMPYVEKLGCDGEGE